MPLSDREQKILAEIERHFYEEDPAFANAVRNIDRRRGLGVRLPLLGAIIGLVIIGATFTRSTFIALAGFAVVVISATYVVQALRARNHDGSDDPQIDSSSRQKTRRRFRRS